MLKFRLFNLDNAPRFRVTLHINHVEVTRINRHKVYVNYLTGAKAVAVGKKLYDYDEILDRI